jgi:NADP-dependent aldehyde dehydrogenase
MSTAPATVTTTDPRDGRTVDTELSETSLSAVAEVTAAAAEAAPALDALGRAGRARLLRAMADRLEHDAEVLVAAALAETGLADARLRGEVGRSAFQFRLFADVLDEGSYLEAAIDHGGVTALGPAPDVRRLLVPLGPVAVFGASNFPFAFSVAGGDTASAIAAGSPVVLKAHPSHPLTSARSFESLVAAAREVGAPDGTFGIVYGQEAGAALVADPRIRAVGFTGSQGAAMALQRIIDGREEPIPLYGELSSINPLIVTPAAATARGEAIADGLFASITGSGGQLCTKPGLAFVPSGEDGDALVDALARLVSASQGIVLLNDRIRDAFGSIGGRLAEAAGTATLATGLAAEGDGFAVPPTLLQVDADRFGDDLAEECFGPFVIVVRYADERSLLSAFGHVRGSLTASLHAEEDDAELLSRLVDAFRPLVGRFVFNGYPTGVRVSWAQHHGGPWPSTNTLHTSVGATAIRRFLRPLAWQDAPQAVLPAELRDGPVDVPRRVDGVLALPTA